jgi:hypothetical protein
MNHKLRHKIDLARAGADAAASRFLILKNKNSFLNWTYYFDVQRSLLHELRKHVYDFLLSLDKQINELQGMHVHIVDVYMQERRKNKDVDTTSI